jgi:hypothetical protein
MTEPLPPGGITPDLAELEARWAGSWRPDQVAGRLIGVSAPWYVAAGWALDLFRGEQTRGHGDIEIAVPATRFPEIEECFPEFEFDAVGSGQIWEKASPEALNLTHQTWLRDPATGRYLLDVFREPHDGETWICRRDPTIRLPYAEIIGRTPSGIPYLVPELVLLFKARKPRPKDQEDFDAVVPLLTITQRDILADYLARLYPDHAWLAALR